MVSIHERGSGVVIEVVTVTGGGTRRAWWTMPSQDWSGRGTGGLGGRQFS